MKTRSKNNPKILPRKIKRKQGRKKNTPNPINKNNGAFTRDDNVSDLLLNSNPVTDNSLPPLPYPYPIRYVIREHLLSLSDSFSSFYAFPCPFTYNDGRSVTLLRIEGSICLDNCLIPLSIWLVESYPTAPPVVYLSPPQQMVRTQENEYVGLSGKVLVPYLTCWVDSVSNLVHLVQHMMVFFSQNPPFCNPKEDLIMEIAEMISKDMNDSETEMEQLIRVKAILKEREEAVGLSLSQQLMRRVKIEQQLEKTNKHICLMGSWLRENKRRMESVWAEAVGNIEKLFEVSVDRGTSDNIVIDWSIEDLIHVLDQALQEGTFPIEVYLKSIRALSREQFFHRAAVKKATKN